MKTKLISENGVVTIELTPENEFETEIVEKIHRPNHGVKYEKIVDTIAHQEHFSYQKEKNHKIKIHIKEIKNEKS